MGKGRRKPSRKVPRLEETTSPPPAREAVTTLGELLKSRGKSLDGASTRRTSAKPGREGSGASGRTSSRESAPVEAPSTPPPRNAPPVDARPVLEDPKDIMAAAFEELASGVAHIDKFEGRGQSLERVQLAEPGRGERTRASEPLEMSRDEALVFDFQREMRGVAPLASTKGRVPGKVSGPVRRPPEGAPPAVDPAPFLEPWPSMQRAQHALLQDVAGFSKLPTLDLHGLRMEPAMERLAGFVSRMRADGALVVLVICGKGLHSPGAPVLREQVLRWAIQPAHRDVRQWAPHLEKDGTWGSLYLQLHPWRTS